jgi:GDPmannose 4,6-dehydratase
MKTALITGITGQDGSYLAELLLSKGYEVHGLIRPASTPNASRIEQYASRIKIHRGDLTNSDQISAIISAVKPNEIYNLAAQSNVGISADMPEYTGDITGLGTTRILEAIRHYSPSSRFYQASSSEMFGDARAPQCDKTPFKPLSPYACAKLYAHWMVCNYRDAYNIFGVNGILYNHESPRRGEIFVTKKVTHAIANILAGKQRILELGALDAKRDWGFAPEYVEAMWKMLQQDVPRDYLIGTGETHTVQEFVDLAFEYAGLDTSKCVKIVKNAFRGMGASVLQADTNANTRLLEWYPKVRFKQLIKVMVDADMRSVGLEPIGTGDLIIQRCFPNKWWIGD